MKRSVAILSAFTPLPLALVTMLACGGGSELRPMLADGRWGDVCRAFADPALEATDLSSAEFDHEVEARAKAKVGISILPGPVAQQVLGGNRKWRRSPFVAQGLFGRDPDEWMDATSLVRDRVLVLSHVESGGPVHAALEVPAFADASPDGSAPSALTTAAELHDRDALARFVGVSKSASECSTSLVDLAGRVANRVTNPATEVLCSATEGRKPTANELAALSRVAPALTASCAPGVAACTEYTFIDVPNDHGSLGALLLNLSFRIDDGCRTTSAITLSLDPARLVDLAPSVDALFANGARPIAELAKPGASPATAQRAPRTAPQVSAANARCQADCGSLGKCVDVVGQCLISSDADCKGSTLCATEGWCSVLEGQAKMGDGAVDSVCVAKTDADCRDSEACKEGGFCRADQNRCVTKSSDDCRASLACTRFGLCTFDAGACRAKTDADCASSTLCTRFGTCKADGGLCR